jgi:hypothetical protein
VFTSIPEGMIFGKVGNWLRGEPEKPINFPVRWDWYFKHAYKKNIPSWIKKPLATCPICMSSVYGTPVFWFMYLNDYIQYNYIIIFYICYIFAIAGLNYLILAFMPNE